MTMWINVFPAIEEGDFPILRRYWSKEEALRFSAGCLRILEVTF